MAATASRHRPNLSLTLDYRQDFELINEIYSRLYPLNPMFNIDDILCLLDAEPALAGLNADVRDPRV